jgi:hypothetical protein
MSKSLRELRKEAKQKGISIKTERSVLGNWDYFLLDKNGNDIWGDGSARFNSRQDVEETLFGIDDWRTRISA